MIKYAGGFIKFKEGTTENEVFRIAIEFSKECLAKNLLTRVGANLKKEDWEVLGKISDNSLPFMLCDNHLSDEVIFLFSPDWFTVKILGKILKAEKDFRERMAELQQIFQRTLALEYVQSVQLIAKDEWGEVKRYSATVQVNELASFLINALEASNFNSDFKLIIIK